MEDVNFTISCALAAKKMGVKVTHDESRTSSFLHFLLDGRSIIPFIIVGQRSPIISAISANYGK